MAQRLGLARALLHEPGPAAAGRARHGPRRRREALLDDVIRAGAGRRTTIFTTHDAQSLRAAGPRRQLARAGARVIADALVLARTNLLLEVRRREVVLGMLQFVSSTLVIVHFALGGDGHGAERGRGMLWVAILLTAVLALNRSFTADHEEAALDALLLAPIDRAAIWLGKVIAQLAFLAVVELFALPLFWLFFLGEDGPDPLPVIAAVALATSAWPAVGVVVAGLAQATRTREVLLPVLFLPLAIPLVIGAVTATLAAVDGVRHAPSAGLSGPLWSFFAVLAWGIFDHLVAE